MLQAILFDLGDTLFDFEPMNARAVFEESARATYAYLLGRGFVLPSFQRYYNMHFSAVRWAYFWAKLRRREFDTMRLLGKLCARMGVFTDEQTRREMAWRCYVPLIEHTTVESDVIATLAILQRSGLKLGLVSNTFVPAFALDRHLEMAGLMPFFPIRVYSSDVIYRKPDRRIFQIALRRLGVEPDAALFVGDLVKTDILGARRVGMRTVLRQPYGSSRTHRVADFVIRRISELTRILPDLRMAPADDPAPLPAPDVACT